MSRKNRNRPKPTVKVDSELLRELEFGTRAFAHGDMQTAANVATQVLSRQPKCSDALHLLGLVALSNQDMAQAIPLLQEAVTLAPKNASMRLNLGIALRDSGDFSSAEKHLTKSVKLKSDLGEAWENLGIVRHFLGRYNEAVDAFERALKLKPDSADIFNNLGITKKALGQLRPALDCFRAALELSHNHAEAHNNFGNILLALDTKDTEQLASAIKSLQSSLRHTPHQLNIRRNLAYLYRKLIPRWHFPMMNDVARNDAYDNALRDTIRPGDVVLDIGSGSGLLAMMAARAGANQVISCEFVLPIADKAREIVSENGYDDIVTIVNKQSDSLVVGEDLPVRADVMVAEIFDTGLIGEGALNSIHFAKKNLLKPGARTIPQRANVYGALIESEPIYQLDRVGTAGGFDVSGFNEFSTYPAYLQERVSGYSHEYLSEPFEIFSFDFRDDFEFSRSTTIPMTIARSGTAHAIAFWFDLYLTDTIIFNTAPADVDSCWQQAIYILPVPIPMTEGDVISVFAYHDERVISLDLRM